MFKKILTIAIILSSTCATFADAIFTALDENNGRIKSVNAGLIILNKNGMDKSFHREVNANYFDDDIIYKKYFFTKKKYQLKGRIESLDRLNAIIFTPVGKVEIQRYKIKNIIMKVPNKGL